MDKLGLKKVVAAVRKAKPKDFHMGFWKNDCGTAGCAIGHFCMRNPKDKLKLIKEPYGFMPSCSNKAPDNAFKSIAYRFGIKLNEAELLFDGHHYQTVNKRNVIRRIERFIKTGKVKASISAYGG
jgi:hypothetical protein